MYKIIGSDQKEYGPISADQVRQWIAEGRINAQTLVQSEADPSWRPLSSFPEFAAGLPSASSPTPFAPQFGGVDTHARAQALINTPAIFLLVVSAVATVLTLGIVILGSIGIATGHTAGNLDSQFPRMPRSENPALGIAIYGVQTIIGVVIIFGAIKMRKLESYGLSMAAAILALIPCVAPCCGLLTLPFGIWALIVLAKPEVKSAFS